MQLRRIPVPDLHGQCGHRFCTSYAFAGGRTCHDLKGGHGTRISPLCRMRCGGAMPFPDNQDPSIPAAWGYPPVLQRGCCCAKTVVTDQPSTWLTAERPSPTRAMRRKKFLTRNPPTPFPHTIRPSPATAPRNQTKAPKKKKYIKCPRAHRVRTVSTISGQTPVHRPEMHAPKQPMEPASLHTTCLPGLLFYGCQ